MGAARATAPAAGAHVDARRNPRHATATNSTMMQGRVAVVTGASKGIGVAIATRLVAEGASVALLARSVDKLQALAAELGSATVACGCDVGDAASVRSAFALIADRFGRVDLLVNNAGIIGMAPLENASDDHV